MNSSTNTPSTKKITLARFACLYFCLVDNGRFLWILFDNYSTLCSQLINGIFHFTKEHTVTLFRDSWLFSVFTSHAIKIKIVAIQWKKSRVWDTIDDWYITNLAKVSAVFHSRVICRNVSPKFIEPCMETPCFRCLCPSEIVYAKSDERWTGNIYTISVYNNRRHGRRVQEIP